MTLDQFLNAIQENDPTALQRFVALIWYHYENGFPQGVSLKQLCNEIESVGHASQNVSRIRVGLKKDRRLLSKKEDIFAINIRHKPKLDSEYFVFLKKKSQPIIHNEFLPSVLFISARGYTKKILKQLNLSYELELYDCCAVMSRRLLETLIIEAFEKERVVDEIKNSDGHFLMFSGLLSKLESTSAFSLGRNAMKGLTDFKSLGDLSAHNRRFNATKPDLDKISSGLRVASEDLLHLAGQGGE